MHTEHHTWDRERRKDGASDWPTTIHSTVISEFDTDRLPGRSAKRRGPSAIRKVILPFVLLLALGGVAVQAMSWLLRS